MVSNPFEIIETRLSSIEDLLLELKHQPTKKIEPTEPELLTIEQVASLLHLSKATIYTKHSKGEIPGVCKRGKRLFFERDVILNWLKGGRILCTPEIEAEADQFLTAKAGRA
jgi:excisionase family DNA binding protein